MKKMTIFVEKCLTSYILYPYNVCYKHKGVMNLSIEEKEQILRVVFDATENMSESQKNYILGYIAGFEDKASLDRCNKVS